LLVALKVTAGRIANAFATSVRQINRDVDRTSGALCAAQPKAA
jgi:predicted DNA-binding transcriptional regulator YafY